MRRALAFALVGLVALGTLAGCADRGTAELEQGLADLAAIENAGERADRVVAFIIDNADMPDDLMESATDAAVAAAEEAGGADAVIGVWEKLYAAEAPPERHYNAMARLDRSLIETDDPDRIAEAEELARELLMSDDAPSMPYLWIAWFHSGSEFTDKELAAEVALAGSRNTDEDDAEQWPSMIERAYGALFDEVAMRDGLDGALARALTLVGETNDPIVAGALNANIYRLAIDEEPEIAADAARALVEAEGFTGANILNSIAYDMAEREFEPTLAVRMSERALALAPSRGDSVNILDTVGWAHYRSGDEAAAAENLELALSLSDATPSSGDAVVQHLLEVYSTGDMDARAIDLLALVVSRSVDADDPARADLESMLVQRDGNAAALEELVAAKRYQGVKDAPPFALPDRSGEIVELAALQGDVLLLCFWSYG